MHHLPQNFLLVNHEGVFRCYISTEQVANFDQLLAKFAREKFIVLRDLAFHPNGVIHLAVNTGFHHPIAILEACKGTMGLQTHYQLIKTKDGQEWLSPRFFANEPGVFELRCEFDFAIWAASGLRMFFAINCGDRMLHLWTGWNGQIYRPPFANVFDTTAAICVGADKANLEEFFLFPFYGLERLLVFLSASVWNGDAFSANYLEPVASLVRFDPATLKMLPPLKPELITKLGVVGHPVIAEIMKLFIANTK